MECRHPSTTAAAKCQTRAAEARSSGAHPTESKHARERVYYRKWTRIGRTYRKNMRERPLGVIISVRFFTRFSPERNIALQTTYHSPHLVQWGPHISTIDFASIPAKSAVLPGRALLYELASSRRLRCCVAMDFFSASVFWVFSFFQLWARKSNLDLALVGHFP